jgi:hypothetical protein
MVTLRSAALLCLVSSRLLTAEVLEVRQVVSGMA